jgi:hypothetical protein
MLIDHSHEGWKLEISLKVCGCDRAEIYTPLHLETNVESILLCEDQEIRICPEKEKKTETEICCKRLVGFATVVKLQKQPRPY